MMKIFKLNDCEWVAGENLEDCKKFLCNLTQSPEDEVIDDPYELSEEQKENLIFKEDNYNKDSSVKRTFKEELELLIKKGKKFPCFFATTEY